MLKFFILNGMMQCALILEPIVAESEFRLHSFTQRIKALLGETEILLSTDDIGTDFDNAERIYDNFSMQGKP